MIRLESVKVLYELVLKKDFVEIQQPQSHRNQDKDKECQKSSIFCNYEDTLKIKYVMEIKIRYNIALKIKNVTDQDTL